MEFYRVWYPVRLRIRTRPWCVSLLDFSYWPSAGSALYFLSHIFSWVWFWSDPVEIKQATWWQPLQNIGCLLQLLKLTLILEWPGQKKKAKRNNPLQYFCYLLQLVKLTLILERPGQKKNVRYLSFIDKKVSAIS